MPRTGRPLEVDLIRESDLTPMYRQWAQAKRDYPDVLLLFRMGDFYEMFGEDAETGARVLGLTLTASRYAGDKKIPMCGLPHHALDRYLRQLVEQGDRAAICEQVEDPKKAKGLVKRQVTRIVTPGTVLEDELLDGSENNFLVAVATRGQATGIASVDISTGDFLVTEVGLRGASRLEEPAGADLSELQDDTPPLPAFQPEASPFGPVLDEVARLRPAEIIVAPADEALGAALQQSAIAPVSAATQEPPAFQSPAEELCEHFGVASLRGFGCEDMAAAQAAAAMALRYLRATQMQALPRLGSLTTYVPSEYMVIDATTRRNLELVEAQRGGRQGSLLALLDKTRTPMGARALRSMVLQPLLSKPEIDRRLDAVATLVRDIALSDALTRILRGIYDMERLLSRVTAGTANARDLRALAASLRQLPAIRDELGRNLTAPSKPALENSGERTEAESLLCALHDQLDDLSDVSDLLDRAIADEPPVTITEGGLIRTGFSSELDELRDAAAHGRDWIAALQDRERARTGIKNLRVGFNQVFGYYIEVTKSLLHLVPDNYTRKQTLANAERYVTPELKEWENKVLGADERAQALEYELFVQVRSQVAQQADRIRASARAVGHLDALLSLALAAVEYGYSRPEITLGDELHIVGGRHPVVERTQPDEPFVPNDARLDCSHQQLLIITGPNMAGKSTYLRQVALITLMAQMGSFVPAEQASIGLVDRIFTRVGASDDLATGQSTFMVEMTETANILHNATDRSLIILDEIGRGTSTFDGLSIAWAVAEYIVRHVGAKTLFATHYHHLNELAEILPRVRNYRILVREEGDHITFLRRIAEGGTDRSYGIQVARLAGLPPEVIARAREVLRTIEQEDLAVSPSLGSAKKIAPTVQLTLFEAAPNPVIEKLKALDPDTLSPIEALLLLKELREGL